VAEVIGPKLCPKAIGRVPEGRSHHAGVGDDDVEPDLFCTAKGLTSGIPGSAVIGKAEIMDAPEPGSMSTTYAGNPLVATAALAVLEIMDEERLLENATKLGNEALESLSELKDRYEFVGDVRGKNCLIIDDMCDTGGSLTKVSLALKQAGAARVDACFTHPVLSGRAAQHLGNSGIEQIVVTNTIPLNAKAAELKNIKVLSIAPLLAKAIKSIHEETSVSSLFV